jgi:hypothetical protein
VKANRRVLFEHRCRRNSATMRLKGARGPDAPLGYRNLDIPCLTCAVAEVDSVSPGGFSMSVLTNHRQVPLDTGLMLCLENPAPKATLQADEPEMRPDPVCSPAAFSAEQRGGRGVARKIERLPLDGVDEAVAEHRIAVGPAGKSSQSEALARPLPVIRLDCSLRPEKVSKVLPQGESKLIIGRLVPRPSACREQSRVD